MRRILWILPILAILSGGAFGSAATVFVTQNGAGSKDGTTLGNAGNCDAVANTPQSTCAFFNNASNWGAGSTQIGQDTVVILSGTVTASPAAGGYLNFQGSGASGHPITLQITGTVQSTHWAANGGGSGCLGGAVCMSSRSFVTLDGASTGVIQNTDNGSSLGSHVASLGVDGYSCTSCSITNISINNIYVNVNGNSTIGDSSLVRAMEINGSGWTIDHLTFHDCGWCIVDFYANGDSNLTISNGTFSNYGHTLALATAGTNAFTNLFFFNNDVGATANWSAPGCFSHQDGIHMFGVTGSSIDNAYVYNNYFHGDWGTCPTGFVFVEAAGSGTPSNLKNSYWWNNVMIVFPGSAPDTSGWFELAQGASGVQKVINNVMIGANNGTGGDNTACMVMQGLAALTYQNNIVSNCGDPITISSSTLVAVDHNVYGPSCQNGGNCFVWNGSFKGSFANWKTACSCDATASIQTNSPLLNSDGSPQASSPVIGIGTNLSTTATGNLITLQNDTTKGGSVVSSTRPTGATAWDIGAFNFSTTPTVATPTFSPIAGTYTSTQSVTISTTTGGATLCYTTDGTTPTANGAGTCTHGTTYTTAVSVAAPETLKAIGSLSGDTDSSVGSAAYVITVVPPTFSPVAGIYTSTQSVTISTTTGGATICYTTDGTTPTANGAGTCTHGTTYSSAVSVSVSLTLKAIGSLSGLADSAVISGAYTIAPVIATPTFSPVAGTYALAQSVTITTSTGGATLCYTSDGTTPTGNGAGTCTHGTTYSVPVSVSSSLTLKAIGTESGFTDSVVGSALYTIAPPPAPCNACMASLPKVIPSTTSAEINWVTVVPTTATLKYGLTPGYGRKVLGSWEFVSSHQFAIVKLKPSTTYHLQLLGQDDAGNTVTTPDEVFATR